ncbi:hypothetical protein ACEWY4_019044 [Coilia grayii]|uniref:Chemokine interleukin-8-like domain-containing protein n=1 Tax=Coilia grayii TaxID=363190 RepID=A0ABD1JF80_9TELE
MRFVFMITIAGALLMAAVAKQRGHFRSPTKVSTRCCEEVSRAVISNIKSARTQNALHPCVSAIVFTNEEGKQFCTDPGAHWVQKALQDLGKLM